MLVLICMLPAECAHNGQGALTTVQLSLLNSAVHIKDLWKAACTLDTAENTDTNQFEHTVTDSPLV